MDALVVILVVLLPAAVYLLARLVSSAYFKSKHDYLKRLMNNDDPPSN